jgi:hypothetical protein
MSKAVKFEFDPFKLVGAEPLPTHKVTLKALEDIADYVKESVLSSVGESESPVAGYGRFKPLSASYRKLKKAEGGTPVSNLELTGAMLSALDCYGKGTSKLVLEIAGEQAEKAESHNHHFGDSKNPMRRFIPSKRETFKKDILEGIEMIIDSYRED